MSHERAQALPHESVASVSVQANRQGRSVPGGLRLHEYVNLYMTARNPMLNLLVRSRLTSLCVVEVDGAVMDIPGVVVTDQNAARTAVRFMPAPDGLEHIEEADVFRGYWTHADPEEEYRRKGAKCAEVLVPHHVPRDQLRRILVGCPRAASAAAGAGPPVATDRHLFFQ